jgi:hypothetical protein
MKLRWAIALALLSCLATPSYRASDEIATTEDLVRCSDLVVLGTVTETLHDGVVAGPKGMIYTRHTLKIAAYFVGSGPQEITVLTPGGYERQPDGRETMTSVIAEGSTGLRTGETFLAFLQTFPPAYRFLNRRGAKILAEGDGPAASQTVRLRFGTVALLGSAAQDQYEKLKADLTTAPEAQRDLAKARLSYALTEAVPVKDLPARMKLVLDEIGGPKPANKICY